MTDRAEREPRTGWETERLDDPADYADSHDTLELYVVTDDDADDLAYPEHEEAPERHRNYKPAAPRHIRDDNI